MTARYLTVAQGVTVRYRTATPAMTARYLTVTARVVAGYLAVLGRVLCNCSRGEGVGKGIVSGGRDLHGHRLTGACFYLKGTTHRKQ